MIVTICGSIIRFCIRQSDYIDDIRMKIESNKDDKKMFRRMVS